MTARDQDALCVLIFADILGFEQMTHEIRVRVEDYPRTNTVSRAAEAELQGRFVRFSNVLDRHVFEAMGTGPSSTTLVTHRYESRTKCFMKDDVNSMMNSTSSSITASSCFTYEFWYFA